MPRRAMSDPSSSLKGETMPRLKMRKWEKRTGIQFQAAGSQKPETSIEYPAARTQGPATRNTQPEAGDQ